MIRFLTDRREWLRIGGFAGLCAALPKRVGAAPAASAIAGFGRAKSVILVVAGGGQSQLETWDPKPNAPAEIRGAFGSVPTTLPGVRLCEHLPRLARLTDRYAIVRSLTHDDTDHGSALYVTLTGRFHARKSSNPLAKPDDIPTYGSVFRRVKTGVRTPFAAVHVNGPVLAPEIPAPGQGAGVLGRGYDPLLVGDPADDPFPSDDETTPTVRLRQRQTLLQAVDAAGADWRGSAGCRDHGAIARQAFELLSSPAGRSAFDLGQESDRVRERYGRYRGGQSCLLARRLVEAGVPFVTVFFNHRIRGQDHTPGITESYGWDTHNDIFEAMRDHLLPPFDHSFSALLEDLHQRGLLDSTLVVCLGEFGRAPRVALEANFAGASPGRKHWAACYSAVLAGAGVRGGQVYGSSDRIAAYPSDRPVAPGDVAATMFAALGIDPAGHYEDAFGRPYPVAEGRPITGLYEGS
jgi:hypothetical protein